MTCSSLVGRFSSDVSTCTKPCRWSTSTPETVIRFRIDPFKALPKYVYQVTKSKAWERWIAGNSKVGTINNINAKQYSSFAFPLPPLEVQRELVAEIEGHQRVIEEARQLIEQTESEIAAAIGRVWES